MIRKLVAMGGLLEAPGSFSKLNEFGTCFTLYFKAETERRGQELEPFVTVIRAGRAPNKKDGLGRTPLTTLGSLALRSCPGENHFLRVRPITDTLDTRRGEIYPAETTSSMANETRGRAGE